MASTSESRVKAARDWATANYEQGGDVIVEATSDEELGEIVKSAKSDNGAVKLVREYVATRRDVENDVRAEGGLEPLGTPADEAKPAKAPKPAPAPAAPRYCKCGCGQQIGKSATFAMGHDARFASNLRKAVKDGTMTPAQAMEQAKAVSPAFERKVAKSLAAVAAEQAKAQADAKPAGPHEAGANQLGRELETSKGSAKTNGKAA